LFDGGGWLLIPEEDIVKKFYDSLNQAEHVFHAAADRHKYPNIRVRLLFIMT
jgi:hypothetical protein